MMSKYSIAGYIMAFISLILDYYFGVAPLFCVVSLFGGWYIISREGE